MNIQGKIAVAIPGYCLWAGERAYKISRDTASRWRLSADDIDCTATGVLADVPPPDGYCGFVELVKVYRRVGVGNR